MAKTKGGKPVNITDVTLRDGHQSILATRLRTEDMLAVAPDMDRVGFFAMEVWGGATFDVTTRFLNEDPWDRVRLSKKALPHTPLMMLLRGQNLVGYRHYADDVVRAFVQHAAEAGIDIFRVFDALNDERNCLVPFEAIKASGKHIQGSLCYSLTETKLGGPVYNLEYYVNKALTFQEMGADSICIKDMAGLIAPDDAYELVKALKGVLKVPLYLHSHYTSGMASMSLLKAIEAGVDGVDTALAPLALRTSHPALEPLVVALQGSPRDPQLDLSLLLRLGGKLEELLPKYRDFLDSTRFSIIDTGVLQHQIPGGMISNLVAQLKEAGALDKLGEVHAELPRVRKELGYPPLVTPTSQIVGIMAVNNVLFGRYQRVPGQVKDYAYGLYGRSPAPIEPEIMKLVLKDYPRGQEPIACRPADILEPELEKAREVTKGLARNLGDVLIYALYPTSGLRFLRWKYGLEAPPPETRPKTLEDVKREDELIALARAGKLVEKKERVAPPKGPGVRTFHVFVEDEYFKVEVEAEGGPRIVQHAVTPPPPAAAVPAPAPPVPPKKEALVATPGETAIVAPMPGVVIRYEVSLGQEVREGQVVVILEAMKMENALPSPNRGKVKALSRSPGEKVNKGDILAIIA